MEKRKVTRYIYNDVRFVIDCKGEIYFSEYDIRKIAGYGNGPLFSKTKSGKKIKIQFEDKEPRTAFYTIKSIREFLKNHNTYKTDKITRLNSLYSKLYNDVVFRNKKDEWLCVDTDDGRAPVHDTKELKRTDVVAVREPNDIEDIKRTLAKINVSLLEVSCRKQLVLTNIRNKNGIVWRHLGYHVYYLAHLQRTFGWMDGGLDDLFALHSV